MHPGQPATATGTAEGDRMLVPEKPAVTVGGDWMATGKACPMFSADPGGRIPDDGMVRDDVARDRDVAASCKSDD